MSLVPNMELQLFTARSEQAALKRLRVADDPAGHEAAVAAAQHAEALRIDEIAAPERLVQARPSVGVVAAAPVADHGAGELLAVALAAARVGVETA